MSYKDSRRLQVSENNPTALYLSDRQGVEDPPCDPTAIGCRSEALGASHLPQIVWEFPVRRIATLHSQRLASGRSF